MILELEHGTFCYQKEKEIFRDISFQLDEGEVLSILGTNGCGKSTLVKCLLGILSFKEGVLKFNQQIVTKLDYHYISYVPQVHTVMFPLTVLEMVTMGRTPYISTFSLPNEYDIRIAQETIQLVGIEHLSNRNCGELSGGELQLVFIARALTIHPKLIILDEPETGLDIANQEKILQLIKKLSNNNVSIIFVTHDCNHALQYSNKTLLFGKNNCMFGNSNEIICEKNLTQAFDIPMVALKSKEEMNYQVFIPRKR